MVRSGAISLQLPILSNIDTFHKGRDNNAGRQALLKFDSAEGSISQEFALWS
jgi:hypothetical protein